MKTHEEARLGGWVRRFLLEHLVVERTSPGIPSAVIVTRFDS